MKILLDSHVIYWWLGMPEKLIPSAMELLQDESHELVVSSASLWELHLKAGKGKLAFPREIRAELERQGFEELPVSWRHAELVRNLPVIHQDPFDRMLIAQAMAESLTLMTRDSFVQQYNVASVEA